VQKKQNHTTTSKKSRKNPDDKAKNTRPGKNGNPLNTGGTYPNAGRPKKYLSIVKEAGYKLSEIQTVIGDLLRLSTKDLKTIAESEDVPALEKLIARGIYGDLRKAELKNLDLLLNRGYGKPNQNITAQFESIDYSKLSDAQLQRLMNGDDPVEVLLHTDAK
jgi:hypothetical protein